MGILAMLLHPCIQALLTAAHSSHLDISFEQFIGHGLSDTGGGSNKQYMLVGEAHNCVCSVVLCITGLWVGKEVLSTTCRGRLLGYIPMVPTGICH